MTSADDNSTVTDATLPLPASSTPGTMEAAANPPSGERKVNWWAELRGLGLMLLGVLMFHTLLAKPFYIPSVSMVPNLLVGDRLVVSKYPYGWSWVSASFHLLPRSNWRVAPATPQYGDIVIAVPPYKSEDYIKRVIGLPGDTIAVVDGQVFLNGEPVPQEVVPPVRIPVADQQMCGDRMRIHRCLIAFERFRVRLPDGKEYYEPPTFRETLPNGASYLIIDHRRDSPADNFPETQVPDGHVFLMGDNRDESADSRVAVPPFGEGLGGPVPLSDVGGRAEFITFSIDGSATSNPLTWLGSLRDGRAWSTLRPPIDEEVAAAVRN